MFLANSLLLFKSVFYQTEQILFGNGAFFGFVIDSNKVNCASLVSFFV